MAGDRQIACDFSKSSASATTSSVLTIAELLGVSLPLLRRMDDVERRDLNDTLRLIEDLDMLPLDALPSTNDSIGDVQLSLTADCDDAGEVQ